MAIKQFTTDTTADPIVMNEIVDKINKFDLDVGDVTSLSTTKKSNVVGAINEVHAETTANTSAIEQMSNSPININPDFKIWQRYNASDSTTFTNPSNKYVVDRYRSSGTGTVKPVASGMEILGTINTRYVLEDADFQKLNGKTLTRSWSENGVIQKETFVCNSAIIFDKTITNKTINFIKIEIGDIATPFSPRSYAEELAMCQRYYYTTVAIQRVMLRVGGDGHYLFGNYSFPTSMRIVPSLSFQTNGVLNQIRKTKDGALVTLTGHITGFSWIGNSGLSGIVTTGDLLVLGEDYDFYLTLDAEIY